jgi:hypothetical protein
MNIPLDTMKKRGMPMGWKRFPVPEFDHGSLKGMDFVPPGPISSDEEQRIVKAAKAGDPSVAGAYAVTPDSGLLERLAFEGDAIQMILCSLPPGGAHVLGRSMAWFNQRAYFVDANTPDAEILMSWQTPRTHNTRLGPENGVDVEVPCFYLLSGRVTEDSTIGNRIMIESDWTPETGGSGYRIVCACNKGDPNFHDSCFMVSWSA